MSFRDCLVVERIDDWFIKVGDETEVVAQSVTTEELVTCVQLMIKLAGLSSPKCILAPASQSCFFTTLPTGDDLDPRDRDALMYELEDHLPLDAESMVADFVTVPDIAASWLTKSPAPAGGESESNSRFTFVSGVAIETERWQAIAEAFESKGIQVRCVIPAASLATRSLCQSRRFTDVVELVLCENNRADFIIVGSDTILSWKHFHLTAETIRRHRLLDPLTAETSVVVGADQETLQLIAGRTAAEQNDEPLETHWERGAELSLSKQSGRWFDLRRDQLAPADPLRPIASQLRWLAIAVAACLFAMILGGWWRMHRIEQEIDQLRTKQQTEFQATFPGVRVPAALMRRVKSEHARVMGSRGASTQVELPRSAVAVMQDLLAGLPSDIRFRVTNISVLNGRVDLDLQVRSPVDAGAFATSLSEAGFQVEPPVTTQKDSKTFDSVLEANWIGRNKSENARDVSAIRVSVRQEVAG